MAETKKAKGSKSESVTVRVREANPPNPPKGKAKPKGKPRKPNPPKAKVRYRRRNPMAQGVGGAIAIGALVGVASEAIDYGADYLPIKSQLAKGAISGTAHAAIATAGAFFDSRLTAAAVACGTKSGIERVRYYLLTKPKSPPATSSGAGAAKPAATPTVAAARVSELALNPFSDGAMPSEAIAESVGVPL